MRVAIGAHLRALDVAAWAGDANRCATKLRSGALCRHCLTALPSERSEDKLVFLINVQAFVLFARTKVQTSKFKRARCAFPLPSGWALMMRAIKCLKGIRWMPWR